MERFVDFSTSEVFGSYAYKVSEGDVTTLGAVGEARWTYAVSKLATEHLAHNYRGNTACPPLSVRPFNIYGPGQVGEGAIHRFIVRRCAARTSRSTTTAARSAPGATWTTSWTAVMLCLEKPEAVGQAFNIGNPRSVVTIYDLARMIIRLSGSASRLAFVDWPLTDVELRIPNIDKARAPARLRARGRSRGRAAAHHRLVPGPARSGLSGRNRR